MDRTVVGMRMNEKGKEWESVWMGIRGRSMKEERKGRRLEFLFEVVALQKEWKAKWKQEERDERVTLLQPYQRTDLHYHNL